MEEALSKASWKERQKEQLRKELIDAALELFQEKGLESTSVDDIVARIGIAKGTFYIYFKSKSELVQAVLENALEDLESRMSTAMANAPEDAPAGLEAVVKALLSFFEAHSAMTDILISGAKLPSDLSDDFYTRYNASTQLIYERLIRKGMLQRHYKEVDAETAAAVLDGIIRSLCNRAIRSGSVISEVSESVLEFFQKGIKRAI